MCRMQEDGVSVDWGWETKWEGKEEKGLTIERGAPKRK